MHGISRAASLFLAFTFVLKTDVVHAARSVVHVPARPLHPSAQPVKQDKDKPPKQGKTVNKGVWR
jgi:hypothetical protein